MARTNDFVGTFASDVDIDAYLAANSFPRLAGLCYYSSSELTLRRLNENGKWYSASLVTADHYPAIYYEPTAPMYYGTACIITYLGTRYEVTPGLGNKSSAFVGPPVGGADFVMVGAPDQSVVVSREPQAIFGASDMGIDGTDDADILLVTTDPGTGSLPITMICAQANTATLVAQLGALTWTIDLTIPSVFVAQGAGEDYVFDPSAVAAAGAGLWGNDAVGGKRVSLLGKRPEFRGQLTLDTYDNRFLSSVAYGHEPSEWLGYVPIAETRLASTEDATPLVVFSTNIGISAHSVTMFTVEAVVFNSTDTVRAMYKRTAGAYRPVAGSATLVTIQSDYTYESNALLDCTFGVNGDNVEVLVTGLAATDLNWAVTLHRPFILS